MTNQVSAKAWEKILLLLEDKLQMGLLEQTRAVVDVNLEGAELTLFVASDESFDYFSSEVNQQRLIIMSRPVISLEKIRVKRRDAHPI